jgi:hypothetical protein
MNSQGSTVYMTNAATTSNTGEAVTFVHILNTTIASVSGGLASLTTAPGTSISGIAVATWGHADDTAINLTTSTALAAGGGLVRFPQALSIVTSYLTVPTQVSYTGEGWGTSGSVIKWISTTDQISPIFWGVNQNPNPQPGCTQALANAQLNNHFTNFEIDGSAATDASFHVQAKGIGLACSANSLVQNMYVHDTMATGIATDFGFPTQVIDNLIVNPGRFANSSGGANGIGDAVSTAGGDSYVFSNNHIFNPANSAILLESEGSTAPNIHAAITGNVIVAGLDSGNNVNSDSLISNGGGAGVTISGNFIDGSAIQSNSKESCIGVDGGTTDDSNGWFTTITGNTTNGCFHGIQVQYSLTASTTHSATVDITGNNLKNALDDGIRIQPNATSMDNLNITGNLIDNNGECGIGFLTAGSVTTKNFLISSNQLSNNGVTTGTDYRKAGICINLVSITGFRLYNNVAFDENSTQKYGLSINTGAVTSADVKDNDFSGVTTTPFNFPSTGTLSGIVVNNRANTFSVSGSSAGTPVGNGANGTFIAGTGGANTVTILFHNTASITSPHGYTCSSPIDETTTSDTSSWTMLSETTTNAVFSGTAASSDKINFGCEPF